MKNILSSWFSITRFIFECEYLFNRLSIPIEVTIVEMIEIYFLLFTVIDGQWTSGEIDNRFTFSSNRKVESNMMILILKNPDNGIIICVRFYRRSNSNANIYLCLTNEI